MPREIVDFIGKKQLRCKWCKHQFLSIFPLLAHEPTCSAKKSNEEIEMERKAESARNYEEMKARRDKKNLKKLKGVCAGSSSSSDGSLSAFAGSSSSFAASSSSSVASSSSSAGSSTAGSMASAGSTAHDDVPGSLTEAMASLMNLLLETNLILITQADEVSGGGDNGGEVGNDEVSKDN